MVLITAYYVRKVGLGDKTKHLQRAVIVIASSFIRREDRNISSSYLRGHIKKEKNILSRLGS